LQREKKGKTGEALWQLFDNINDIIQDEYAKTWCEAYQQSTSRSHPFFFFPIVAKKKEKKDKNRNRNRVVFFGEKGENFQRGVKLIKLK
jgi:hypothetical protein